MPRSFSRHPAKGAWFHLGELQALSPDGCWSGEGFTFTLPRPRQV